MKKAPAWWRGAFLFLTCRSGQGFWCLIARRPLVDPASVSIPSAVRMPGWYHCRRRG